MTETTDRELPTRVELIALADRAAYGNGLAMKEVKGLARYAGYVGGGGGWIRCDGYAAPVTQGWKAFAGRVTLGGWLADRLLEQSETRTARRIADGLEPLPWDVATPDLDPATGDLMARSTEDLMTVHRAAGEVMDTETQVRVEAIVEARFEADHGGSPRESADPEQTMPEGWTDRAPGFFTAPIGTPAPEFADRIAKIEGAPEIQARRISREETGGRVLVVDRPGFRMDMLTTNPDTREAVVRSGPHAGSVVRTGAAERPFLSPIERPEQDPMPATDVMLIQLLSMLDDGTTFELHPDGVWRDRGGLTGTFLDAHALGVAVRSAIVAGLARRVGTVPNPTLVPGPVHLAVGTGRTYRALCPIQAHHHGPTRLRLSHDRRKITCGPCKLESERAQRDAKALSASLDARGIVVDAQVTIHRGTRVWEVLEVQEDMARVAPVPYPEEVDAGQEFAPQWMSVDLLHPVPARK